MLDESPDELQAGIDLSTDWCSSVEITRVFSTDWSNSLRDSLLKDS